MLYTIKLQCRLHKVRFIARYPLQFPCSHLFDCCEPRVLAHLSQSLLGMVSSYICTTSVRERPFCDYSLKPNLTMIQTLSKLEVKANDDKRLQHASIPALHFFFISVLRNGSNMFWQTRCAECLEHAQLLFPCKFI